MEQVGPYLIADIGSNFKTFQGTLTAIQSAKECGFDAVKFQLFSEKELYGYGSDETQLDPDWLSDMAKEAKDQGIDFMCTAFSEAGMRLVDPYVCAHKIASSELVDRRLFDLARTFKKPIILSAGPVSESEIEPFVTAWNGNSQFTILECVSKYPAEPSDYNLRWLEKYRLLGFKIGVSDHTQGRIGIAASTMLDVIEVHLDPFQLDTPDSADKGFAMTLTFAKDWISAIRGAAIALKKGSKDTAGQHEAVSTWKRRLKVIRDIKAGEKLVLDDNYGIYRSKEPDLRADHAFNYQQYNGLTAKVDLKQGAGLWREDVE